MNRKPLYPLCVLAAAVAGCSARAEAERRTPGEAGEVRADEEALRSLLTPTREVSVVGTARTSVVPDVAEVAVGVSSARPTAIEAVEANNRAMAGVIEALKGRGIAAKDIQTSQVSITPQYSRPAEPKPGIPEEMTVPKVIGYEVANVVRVTTKDRAKLGTLLDAAIQAGANQIYGINFRIDDREAVLAGLRAQAFDSAKAKAELYARRAGLLLGPVYRISESDPAWMAAPQATKMDVMAAPMAPAPGMPVSEGEQEVSLSVGVSFELKLAR